jgi:translation initiation factor IF-3
VKITIMFRGREVTHPERGTMILDRLAEELNELAVIEQRPNLDGRNMTMLLGPSKAVLSGTLGKEDGDGDGDGAVAAEQAPSPAAANGASDGESAESESADAEPEAAESESAESESAESESESAA